MFCEKGNLSYNYISTFGSVLIIIHDASADVQIKTLQHAKYKKVKNGFLITYTSRISNVNVTTANLTYYVDAKFNITLVSTKHVVVMKGMDI